MASRPVPTITCVGIAVQDLVFSIPRTLAGGAKNLATSLRTVGGGPAANAAVTIARLGGRARLIVKLGDDAVGDSIVDDLRRNGVEVSGVRRLRGVPSPLSSVAVDPGGERTIVNHTDRRLNDGAGAVTIDELDGTAAVLVDLRWPDGARSALAAAAALGIPSVVDFDLTGDDPPFDVVQVASHVVFSQPALMKLAATNDVDRALRSVAGSTPAFVAVTLGADGVRWVERDSIRSQPAFAVDVVDTLGAGDVFHGAFALAIASDRSIDDAMRFAAGASALTCTTPGGRAGIPDRAQLESFLESRTR